MTQSMTGDERAKLRRWRWRVFSATYLSYAGLYFARKPFSIAKSSVGDALNWDPQMLGVLGAVYLITYTIGQFIAGAAGNKWGPRVVLLVGMLTSVAANASFGFVNSFYTFAAFMGLNGFAQSTGWSNNVGTMGNWTRRDERGTVMGIWATNFQVGGVLANGLAAWFLGTQFGYRWSFLGGSIVLLVMWVYVLVNHRNRPEDVGLPSMEDEARVDVSGSAVDSTTDHGWSRGLITNVLFIGVFYFFVKFIRYSLWSWAPYILTKEHGLTPENSGYISTIFDVCGIAGVLLCGYLSDYLFNGRRTTIALIFIVGMVVSAGALKFLGAQSVTLFAVSMGFVGFFLYGPDALMTGAGAIDVGSAKRATLAAGIINGMGSIGSVVQEFVLGKALKNGNVDLVFGMIFASSIGAFVCLCLLALRNHSGKADV